MKNISPKEKNYIESNSRYSRHAGLISLKTIFSNRSLWALMGMYFCSQWANYFFIAWSPIYLQEKLHFSEKQTQPIIFILFVVGIVGLLFGGFCIDWVAKKKGLFFGRRFIGMTGIALVGISILLAAITTNSYFAASCIIAANGFYSFGVMAAFAVCTDIAKNNAGTVTGAMNSCGQLGAFFMSLVVGKMVEVTHSFSTPVFVIAAAQFVGFLLWLLIDPTRQLRTNEEIKK
jgi:sugar phosphate permease